MTTINPKIIEKVSEMEIPPKLKKIINEILTTEEELQDTLTQKQFLASYHKLLEQYGNDKDLAKFCDKYEQQ